MRRIIPILALLLAFIAPPSAVRSAVDMDYGDAPNSYSTTLGANGARHVATGLLLGQTRDADPDGQPSAGADADDLDADGDDEDGITFLTPFVPGQVAQIQVVVSGGTGRFFAYFDWDQNGFWNHNTLELGANHVLLGPGTHVLNVAVPTWAVNGATFARFRISTFVGQNQPANSDRPDGEVEDYAIQVGDGPTPVEARSWGRLKADFR